MIKKNEHILSLIRNHSIFATLTEAEDEILLQIMERRTYQESELVFTVDQKAANFFLVESGEFLLSLRNRNFKKLVCGEVFGEIGMINESLRTGTIRASEASKLLVISAQKLFDERIVPSKMALKIILALAKNVTNYLRSREHISTTELIEAGENDHVEFKSTLRWNLFTQKKDKAIEHAALKTIAAFLNDEGGTLLIGVADEGKMLGLDNDRFPNDDRLLLHLNKLIQDRIGVLHAEFVKADVEIIGDKKVLRIDCEASTIPAYISESGSQMEYFYIRSGPATTSLPVSKVYDYIRMRFG